MMNTCLSYCNLNRGVWILGLVVFFMLGTSLFAGETVEKLGEKTPEFRDRWFYTDGGLGSDEEAEKICQVIRDAGDVGLNGFVWACGLESCGKWTEERKVRFLKIKKVADDCGVEIIPMLWSIGYGTALGHNSNLVESALVDDLQVVVKEGKVVLAPGVEAVEVKNGDMEAFNGDRLVGYRFNDAPGLVTFHDTEVAHSGKSSLRLENFAQNKHGHGRVLQTLEVVPHRNYRISVWYRAEDMTQRGVFRLQVYAKNESLATTTPILPEDGNQKEWRRASVTFASGENTQVNFYFGVWGGEKGTLWLDDLAIESTELSAPVQRPGTPVTVKNTESGEIYDLGRDYTLPKFNLWEYCIGKKASPILIPQGSRIEEGMPLTLSYYLPVLSQSGQTSTCMSEPEVYEFFEASATAIKELFAPKRWFLSMDEIRAANSCAACEKRNLPLSEILGDCITRQYNIIQKTQPGAEVYIWSDMLDPKHNCRADYMNCRGDFTGVWDCIPKELIISCWYHGIREESMKFFSEHGFRTQGAAYYDVDTLDTSREWLETCRRTPNCMGIMYTTWQRKYQLLKDFGKMLQ